MLLCAVGCHELPSSQTMCKTSKTKNRTRRLSSARSAFLRGRALHFSGYSPVLRSPGDGRQRSGPEFKERPGWGCFLPGRPPRLRGNLWVPVRARRSRARDSSASRRPPGLKSPSLAAAHRPPHLFHSSQKHICCRKCRLSPGEAAEKKKKSK